MQQGFVLVTTLIMTMLLSLLAISALQSSIIETRMSVATLHVYQHDAGLSAGIDAGISLLLHTDPTHNRPACWLLSPIVLAPSEQPAAWWQYAHACTGKLNNVQYQYVIEQLSEATACFQYYRITSHLQNVLQRTWSATVLIVNDSEIQANSCELSDAEEQLIMRLPQRSLLSSIYAQ